MNSQDFLNSLWKEYKGIIVAGYTPSAIDFKHNHPGIEILKRTEWNIEFETELRKVCNEHNISFMTKERIEYILTLMRNRLIMGSFRYGLMAEQDYSRFNLKALFDHKVNLYATTENLECLIDAMNMMLISYVHGSRTNENLVKMNQYIDVAYKVVVIFCRGLQMGQVVKAEDDKDHAQERITK